MPCTILHPFERGWHQWILMGYHFCDYVIKQLTLKSPTERLSWVRLTLSGEALEGRWSICEPFLPVSRRNLQMSSTAARVWILLTTWTSLEKESVHRMRPLPGQCHFSLLRLWARTQKSCALTHDPQKLEDEKWMLLEAKFVRICTQQQKANTLGFSWNCFWRKDSHTQKKKKKKGLVILAKWRVQQTWNFVLTCTVLPAICEQAGGTQHPGWWLSQQPWSVDCQSPIPHAYFSIALISRGRWKDVTNGDFDKCKPTIAELIMLGSLVICTF